MRQRTGDKAEKEKNTGVTGERLLGDDNSIRVNDLIYFWC